METRLKHRFAEYLTDVLSTMAAGRIGDFVELHGAEVELVSNLLVQVRVPQPDGSVRIIEIKVSEPST
jgi:hypothetical protein